MTHSIIMKHPIIVTTLYSSTYQLLVTLNLYNCCSNIIQKLFCIPITFNNPLKACFSNKNITIQTHPTQVVKVHFLMKKSFQRIFKDHWCTKLITYHFFQIQRVITHQGQIFYPHTYKYLTFNKHYTLNLKKRIKNK